MNRSLAAAAAGPRHGSRFLAGDSLAILAPTLAFIEFASVGRLFLTEIILIAALPFLLAARGRRLLDPLPRSVILLAALWLASQIVTDLVRATPFEDYARGWAKILFFTLNFAAIYLLVGDRSRRIVLFMLGLAIGGLLTYLFSPGEYAADYPWKFGYGQSVTWLMAIAATVLYGHGRSGSVLAIAVVAAAGALNVLMGFRSLGGLCLIAAMLLAGSGWLIGRNASGRLSLGRMSLLAIAIVLSGILVLETYTSLAASGALGVDAQQKYERQASGRLGILLGGRSELLVSSRAVADSPIIGHGSWARDVEYAIMRADLLEKLGYAFYGDPAAKDLIPTHSHLFGAWVEAGIFGGLFWICALVIAGRGLYATLAIRPPLAPLLIVIFTLAAWHILFSPFGAQLRYQIPFMIVCAIGALRLISPASANAGRRPAQIPQRATA